MTAWYVAYTEPRAEQRVHDALQGSQFGVYLPLEQRARIYRGEREEYSRPLFPRYVFISFDRLADSWGDLYDVDGLVEILMDGSGNPLMVPIWQIEELRRAEAGGAFMLKSPFNIGDAVLIAVGPFAGLRAKLKSCSGSKRVKVLMEFLGSNISVDLGVEEVERI